MTLLASFDRRPVKPARAPPPGIDEDELEGVGASKIEVLNAFTNNSRTQFSFLDLGDTEGEEEGEWRDRR